MLSNDSNKGVGLGRGGYNLGGMSRRSDLLPRQRFNPLTGTGNYSATGKFLNIFFIDAVEELIHVRQEKNNNR